MRHCLHCGVEMPKPKGRTQKYWDTRLYCSKKCETDPIRRTELFLSDYTVDPETGCHLSQASTFDKDGYPEVHISGVHWRGHRLSYSENKGPIPKGMLVRHTCDDPRCINAEHLLIGTVQDNSNDMVSRGRSVVRTGVHPSNISMIKAGRRWSHLG